MSKPTPRAKASPASATTKPAAAAAPGQRSPRPVEAVVVTGAPPAYRSAIDRRSYSLAGDLQTTTGSLADALRNVPSVEVDVQGGISLRGDANVTILVDGKPSALFSGPSRADALQQLPADQYERVEVLTNPSAAFRPDGTAGIINLVSKKGRGAGRTGSVRANIGTEGRYNGGVSAAYNDKKLSLSGSVGFRHDGFAFDNLVTRRVVDPLSGLLTGQRSDARGRARNESQNGRASLDYDLDAKTRLSAEIARYQARGSPSSTSVFRSDALSGPLAQDYRLAGSSRVRFGYTSSSATLLRKFSGDEHELSVRLSYDSGGQASSSRQAYAYSRPVRPDLFQDLASNSDEHQVELTAEYKRPMPADAKLVAGYELQLDHDVFDHSGLIGTSSLDATLSAPLTNLFKFDQSVNALYATYQRPIGKFTVLPGLRLEQVSIGIDQVTSRITAGQSYFSAYPTLHVNYKLTDAQTLTASYSRRVQRPDHQYFNPYLVYQGPLSYEQGNPQLKPQVTDAFELGYEFRQRATYYQATAYFRENTQGVVDVVRDLGGGVLLTTKDNLGASRSAGLELVANGRLSKTLTYNASGNLFWNEIDAANLGFAEPRSTASLSGRVNLNWEPTKADFVQLNAYARGKSLTPQGYREPAYMLNLGYRHKFNDKLSGVMTIQDPFDTAGSVLVIDTPMLKQRVDTRLHQRGVFFGLTYALGAPNKRRPEAFDFGGGGGGGPGGGAGPP